MWLEPLLGTQRPILPNKSPLACDGFLAQTPQVPRKGPPSSVNLPLLAPIYPLTCQLSVKSCPNLPSKTIFHRICDPPNLDFCDTLQCFSRFFNISANRFKVATQAPKYIKNISQTSVRSDYASVLLVGGFNATLPWSNYHLIPLSPIVSHILTQCAVRMAKFERIAVEQKFPGHSK